MTIHNIMEKTQIIKNIEKQRNSRVITYLTSDRNGPVNARVAMDIIPIISKQLSALGGSASGGQKIGKVENIDLFLYSSGGDTMVPWRLVSMIREYCDKFSVIIPYKAHSAATMISLGADEIVMSDLSELSPIDPSTANIFNPSDPANPQSKIPISVEDVMAYFDLAKNKFGIKNDEDLAKIFNKFVEANPQIHPLALGNVNRTHNLIRMLAKRLLKSHKTPMKEDEIDKIVDYFTEKQRAILMYHELLHIPVIGNRLIKHNIEDFFEVLQMGIDWASFGAEVPNILAEKADDGKKQG